MKNHQIQILTEVYLHVHWQLLDHMSSLRTSQQHPDFLSKLPNEEQYSSPESI